MTVSFANDENEQALICIYEDDPMPTGVPTKIVEERTAGMHPCLPTVHIHEMTISQTITRELLFAVGLVTRSVDCWVFVFIFDLVHA